MRIGLLIVAALFVIAACSSSGRSAQDVLPADDVAGADADVNVADVDVSGDAAIPEDGADATLPEDVPLPEDEVEPLPCLTDADCNDLDPCTTDKCQAGYGCVNTPKNCSDGNACTTDSCLPTTGACKHAALECKDDNECTIESCDEAQGCVYKPRDCSDGDPCTADGCLPQMGCTNKLMDCDDGDPCTVDSCDKQDGCQHQSTTDPDCCVADFQCDDGKPCTQDACKQNSCANDPIADLKCCQKDLDCDDGNTCTEDLCVEGLCQYFAAGLGCCMKEPDCNDADGCTVDTCVGHFCQYAPVPGCCHDDAGCDDKEVCTTDVCSLTGGEFGFCENKKILGCCHGQAAECDDGNLCTLDACPGVGKICENKWAQNCCLSAADCDDKEKCTVDTCLDNQCGHDDVCCLTDKECDDDDDLCTDDFCVDDFCQYEPTGAAGCCMIPLFEDDFSTNKGWQYGKEWERGQAKASTCQGYNGPDPAEDHTGSNDNFVAGILIGGCEKPEIHDFYYLTSPSINAGGKKPLRLSYWRWLNSDYEPYMTNVVDVFDGAQWVNVSNLSTPPGMADASWQYQEFDVSDYANAKLQVRFGYKIGSGGVFIVTSWNVDDVLVYTPKGPLCCKWTSDCNTPNAPDDQCVAGTCMAGECSLDLHCTDEDAATVDKCFENACLHVPVDKYCESALDCYDGDACTAEKCVLYVCDYPEIAACCLEDASCADDDPCTDDKCVQNKCSNTPIPNCP